ncbi:hypothetical protein C8J56DRAFT_944057, partial [Mycena floridula]
TGSWCFSLNGLVYTGAGRIKREPTGMEPIFHGLPYIEGRPSNMTYLVDVSSGALHLILLQQNQHVMGASPLERHVVQRIARTDLSLESSTKELHLESWTSRVMYSFIEDEFFVSDFKNFNYSILG